MAPRQPAWFSHFAPRPPHVQPTLPLGNPSPFEPIPARVVMLSKPVVFLELDLVQREGFFLPDPVALLNGLVLATGAVVVVSSPWRRVYALSTVENLLRAAGFEGKVVGFAPPVWMPERNRRSPGDEYAAWLRMHPATSAVILDTAETMACLTDRLVRIDPKAGLTQNDVNTAITVLGRSLCEEPVPQAVAVLVEKRGGKEVLFAAMCDRSRYFRASFPGGKIDLGETPAQAGVRETLEETGLRVTCLEPLGVRKANTMVCQLFVALYWAGELRESEEGPVLWATRDQLLNGAYPEWSAWALMRYDAWVKREMAPTAATE